MVALLSLAMALPAAAAEVCEQSARVVEISPGVYLRPGRHGIVFEVDNVANLGFLVGQRCVAVIDTGGSEAEGRALRCAIRRVTERPVCYVVTTHAHPDHMLGNIAFKGPGTTFVGHEKLPRAMALLGPTYVRRAEEQQGRTLGPGYLVPPDATVDRTLRLDLGERFVTVRAHGKAHTDHDLSVYDEASGTLWLSDLMFVEHVPVLHGSLLGWLRELDGLAEHGAERVVPGHGPVQEHWPAAAADTVDYLRTLRDETRAFITGGGDLRAAMEEIGYNERSRWRLFDQYHKRNVTSAYTELEWE